MDDHYLVKLKEDVFDAFDEFEHQNTIETIVNANSPEEAKTKAKEEMFEYRRKNGFLSTGMFFITAEEATKFP